MWLTTGYVFHLWIRLLHDKTYEKVPAYKNYSDKKYTSAVHRAVLTAFVASFVVFLAFQSLIPALFKPNTVQAATNSKTWTTNGDFAYNKSSFCNQTTQSNVAISGAAYTDNTCAAAAADSTVTLGTFTLPSLLSGVGNDAGMVSTGGDYVYIAPGNSSTSFFRYSISGNSLLAMTSAPKQFNFGGPGSLTYPGSGDFIYALIDDENTPANDLYKYSISGNSWTLLATVPSIPGPGASLASTKNDFIYVLKGDEPGWYTGTKTIWRYSISGNSWAQMTDAPGNINAISNITYPGTGDFLYTMSGNSVSNAFWRYSISGNSWASVTAPSGGWAYGSALASNGSDYIYSYVTGSAQYFKRYSISGNSWTDLANPPSLPGNGGAIVYSPTDGNIYGIGSGTSLWRYVPGGNVWNPSYRTSGSISGLKIDSGAGVKSKWSQVSWNSAALPANTTISFKARTSDDNATWSDSTWANASLGTQSTLNSTTGTGALSSLASTRYLELQVALASSGGVTTPTLNDFTVSYDSLESPINTNTTLKKSDGSTVLKDSTGATLAAGSATGFSNEQTVKLTTTGLTCTSCGTFTNPYIELEYEPLGTAFKSDGTANTGGAVITGSVDGSNASTATLTNLSPGTSYHLQIRAKDAQGRVSGWTSYGNNLETVADLTIDQVAPTLTSITLNGGSAYANSTSIPVTITGAVDTDSKLSKLYLSNDATTWTDVTASATGFAGSATYTGTLTSNWSLASGDGAKTVYAKVIDNGGNQYGAWTQSTTANFTAGTRGTDLALGTNAIYLLKQNGATAASASECLSNYSSGGVCAANPWITGASPLSTSVLVYSQDLSGYAWGPTVACPTGTNGSQPCQVGVDSGAPSYTGLINPQTYPAMDFTSYPAQNACKAIGGRLPTYTELGNIYTSRASYGGFNTSKYYWASIDAGSTQAYVIGFSNGGTGFSVKNGTTNQTRCVKDGTLVSLGGSGTAGTFISATNDFGAGKSLTNISWSATIPAQSGLSAVKFQIGAKDADSGWTDSDYKGPDGGTGTYYTTSGGAAWSGLNSHRYVRYKAYLSTANSSYVPVLNGVTVGSSPAATITLDAVAPTGTLAINGSPTYMNSTSVNLKLDPVESGSGMQDFALSNDSGATWSAWTTWSETYRTGGAGYAWTLASGDGYKKVYVKYRDNALNVGGNYDPNWIPGLSSTALAGKGVYKTDLTSQTWGGYGTSCVGPQCASGLDPTYPSKNVLVSPQQYPLVDFTTYQTQNACSALGGRLPNVSELNAVYAGRTSYGNNFITAASGYYWTATESDPSYAYQVWFNNGSVTVASKNTRWYTRCVSDTGPGTPIQTSTTLDMSAPITTLTATPSTPNGSNGWYNGTSKPSISLSSVDGVSKTYQTFYRWDTDAAPYTTLTNGSLLDPYANTLGDVNVPEGTHTLYWYSTDVAGNSEVHHSQAFKIDIQKPTTAYNISPASPSGQNSWYVSVAPTITLTPTDPNSPNYSAVATTYYQWVAHSAALGSWSTYTTALTAPQGDKDLYYYTVDMAGNTEAQNVQHIKFNANAPGIPSNFRAPTSEASTTTIVLHWDAVTNDDTGIAAYHIQRRKQSGVWADLTLGGCGTLSGSDVQCTDDSLLDSGFYYGYRIKAVDNGGVEGSWSDPINGYTIDTVAPGAVTNVTASACDGTVYDGTTNPTGKCTSAANKGYEVKVSWSASSDSGVGMSRYLIYRSTTYADSSSPDDSAWTLIGVVTTGAGQGTLYFDNDTTNAAIGLDKTLASPALNDSNTNYYYRITAYDLSGNHTPLIDRTGGLGDPAGTANQTSTPATTPDVTAPSIPANVIASPAGIDPNPASILPEDPAPKTTPILHQRLVLTWSPSTDFKHYHPAAETSGNSVTYHIFELKNGTYTEIGTTTSLVFNIDGLQDFTIYSFKVVAVDSSPSHNPTDFTNFYSDPASGKTASSAVPTVPTEVTVTSKKGNPNTDTTVGRENTITFFGSYAKNCDPNANTRCLVRYEVYRSTTNYLTDAEWTTTGNSTLISQVTPNNIANDRKANDLATPYSVTDSGQTYPSASGTGLSDTTTYYYKVRALDNTPAQPDGGPYYSPMSVIAVGTLHAGWDMTGDATAPALPADLTVKDIHDDGMSFKRNIITWGRIATPTRLGANDFLEYRIYRSEDNLTWQQICQNGTGVILLPACTTQYPNPLYKTDKILGLANNYFMDLIPLANANQNYYYYVTAADDAATAFKYPAPNQSTVVNSYSNESAPNPLNHAGQMTVVNINPAVTHTNILPVSASSPSDPCRNYNGQNACIVDAGVSSAVISWTTDQTADSVVEFKVHGSSDPYVGVIDRFPTQSHKVTIKPLLPNTRYDYQITSRNSLKNDTTIYTADLPTLTTSGFTITPGIVITTTTTAEVDWSTNLDSSSAFVEYQLQKQPGDEAQSGTAGVSIEDLTSSPRNIKVVIKGLRSGRAYTYKIKSISKDNYLAETAFATFRTQSFDTSQFSLAPASSNVADKNITSTTAQIVWQTATPTTSWVDFGTKSGIYDTSAGDNQLNYQHVVTLTGLVPGTRYYYKVRVKDSNELEYNSQEYNFTAVIKPKISNLQVKNVTPYTVTIAWDTNVDTETVLNWGTTASYGSKQGSAGKSQVHQVTVENLNDNTEYHYQIVAHDEAGNEVVGPDEIVRTPLDTEGPKITNVKTDIMPLGDSDTTSQVIISWTTNKPATTKVEYDEGIIGGHYTKTSTEDQSLNNSHTVIVKGLSVASTYHYRIVTKDKRGNQTTSNDYTFVTPNKEQSIWQLIVKSLQDTFAWTKNLGNLFKRK